MNEWGFPYSHSKLWSERSVVSEEGEEMSGEVPGGRVESSEWG
jgi:hypothetical protein